MKRSSCFVSTVFMFLLAGCSARQPYEGAMKMNALSVGMTKTQLVETMGLPATTSARGEYECAEYVLLEHSVGFVRSRPDTYYAVMRLGQVIEFGNGSCYSGRLDVFIGRDEADSKARQTDRFEALSIGMTKAEFLAVVTDGPSNRVSDDRYGLECMDYFFPASDGRSKNRFAAFKNGHLIASGNSTCGREAAESNFVPGGKYHYLIAK